MELTIYLTSGTTLRFSQVEKKDESDENVFIFEYVSKSRNVKCRANFFYKNISGFSFDV